MSAPRFSSIGERPAEKAERGQDLGARASERPVMRSAEGSAGAPRRQTQKGKGPAPCGTGPPWEGDVFVLSGYEVAEPAAKVSPKYEYFLGVHHFFLIPSGAAQ
jgi:hypothetical protein